MLMFAIKRLLPSCCVLVSQNNLKTPVFLSSSLTTSVPPHPRLGSKTTQLVKGNRRKKIHPVPLPDHDIVI